ncbi:uncharacterized protein LOC143902091 [Temnothorax americanus]|uniref:uncharacterized protein LOC143902091 n=1 Tax=Temnothorax americanus TaxID=1964332 RepID=UPI004068111C
MQKNNGQESELPVGRAGKPDWNRAHPSPSTTQLGKRPKIAADQRTFAQATSGLARVAMVPMEYPELKLDQKEAVLLRDKVREGILGIAKCTKASTFRSTNKGLQAADWVVARGSESRDATSTHFAALIGEGTLSALKALNFKPFCGLSQATVRLPGGDRRGELERKEDGPRTA